MARVGEVECFQGERTESMQRVGVRPRGLRGGDTEPGQGPREAGSTYTLTARPPPLVLLTIMEPHGLQRPEQLSADVLTVPAGFSQALGHCEVNGAGIMAGVRARTRVMTS